jgi:hypothetical protein
MGNPGLILIAAGVAFAWVSIAVPPQGRQSRNGPQVPEACSPEPLGSSTRLPFRKNEQISWKIKGLRHR